MTPDLPLPPPAPLGYLSTPPYLVSFDFDSGVTAWSVWHIREAIALWNHPSAPIFGYGAPRRRIVVDGRGVMILGLIADLLEAHSFVMTTEIADHLRSVGSCDELTRAVLDLELEMMMTEGTN